MVIRRQLYAMILCISTLVTTDIPIFGVLTKEDKRQGGDNFEQLEKDFKSALGLSELHFLLCTTYCDDNIKQIKSGKVRCLPHLDITILKFLWQVKKSFYTY
jgi:hypothetical protein